MKHDNFASGNSLHKNIYVGYEDIFWNDIYFGNNLTFGNFLYYGNYDHFEGIGLSNTLELHSLYLFALDLLALAGLSRKSRASRDETGEDTSAQMITQPDGGS